MTAAWEQHAARLYDYFEQSGHSSTISSHNRMKRNNYRLLHQNTSWFSSRQFPNPFRGTNALFSDLHLSNPSF